RADFLYQQLAALKPLRQEARQLMIKAARGQRAYRYLITIPLLGPVSVAQLIAIVSTPHRFRSKRQFWTYVGLAVVTVSTADHEVVNGVLRRSRRRGATRGLNRNHNHVLKRVFKNAAVGACHRDPFQAGYQTRLTQGMDASLARLTIARQLSAITLAVWKSETKFKSERMKQPATT
ncbi:MAG TPA: transposase, partial [Pyrinomonadaceae bacterium]